ncbi:MAG: hypothetical protein U0228_37330 [Myxococcaceae bacterium]
MRALEAFRHLAVVAALCAVALGGCTRDLTLPDPPPPGPVITAFSPHAGFSGDRLVVWGDDLVDVGNQLVFGNGTSVLAVTGPDGGDEREDGGVVFTVPFNIFATEPVVVTNQRGRSAPSADCFTPLGYGHPIVGGPVASLRFRHAPVGLVDRLENVLLGSSLFDLVLTDGKAFQRVPGRPVALERSSRAGRAFVSVRTAEGGLFLEVDDRDGTVLLSSTEDEVRERFILQPTEPTSIATTIGEGNAGQVFLSQWGEQNGELVRLSKKSLDVSQVAGAASEGSRVVLVARGTTVDHASTGLWSVTSAGAAVLYEARANADCLADPDQARCQPPDGPIALVPASTGGSWVVASVASGDLLVLDGTNKAGDITLISYAPVDDLSVAPDGAALPPGLKKDKVLISKSHDGALFQYDLTSGDLDWSVQLRGEPTVIAIAPDIDEIAVANRAENAVDTIDASTGRWSGRIAFDLGLGAAKGRTGGIVPTYSYDPAAYPGVADPKNFVPAPTLDLLMRNIGLVLTIDASSLEILGSTVLSPDGEEPQALLVTSKFETVVMHRRRIGLLEGTGDRTERILTPRDIAEPLDALLMPDDRVITASVGALEVFGWTTVADGGRELVSQGRLTLAANEALAGIARSGDQVLVVTSTGGTFHAALWPVDQLRAGGRGTPLDTLPPMASAFAGTLTTRHGPLALFGGSANGPTAWSPAATAPSVILNGTVAASSPDGRFLAWVDERAPEPMVRLIQADFSAGGSGFSNYSSYRFPATPQGPGFDPSGQWLYLPLTSLDQLDVVQ